MRLLHREALISVIGSIVRDKLPPTRDNVRRFASRDVSESDLELFVELARRDLLGLHEGNVSRYRLRLSEYREWRKAQSISDPEAG